MRKPHRKLRTNSKSPPQDKVVRAQSPTPPSSSPLRALLPKFVDTTQLYHTPVPSVANVHAGDISQLRLPYPSPAESIGREHVEGAPATTRNGSYMPHMLPQGPHATVPLTSSGTDASTYLPTPYSNPSIDSQIPQWDGNDAVDTNLPAMGNMSLPCVNGYFACSDPLLLSRPESLAYPLAVEDYMPNNEFCFSTGIATMPMQSTVSSNFDSPISSLVNPLPMPRSVTSAPFNDFGQPGVLGQPIIPTYTPLDGRPIEQLPYYMSDHLAYSWNPMCLDPAHTSPTVEPMLTQQHYGATDMTNHLCDDGQEHYGTTDMIDYLCDDGQECDDEEHYTATDITTYLCDDGQSSYPSPEPPNTMFD